MSPALLRQSLLLSRPGSTRPSRSRSRRPSLALALGLVAAVASTPSSVRTAELRPALEAGEPGIETGAFRHLRALSQIATRHGGNRAAGTPGYDASANHIGERLREAGYAVRFEPFEVPLFEERSHLG
jgi:hypothetical protein